MQARYYDPVIGRFYSNDPVGYTPQNPVMSFNRYMYVNNNPYKYNDPDGEFLNSLVGGLVGGIVSVALDAGSAMLSGQDFSMQQAAGSFVGGAATGAMVANGVPLTVANGLGSAIGEGVTQIANAATGKEASFGKVVTAGIGGAITGKVPDLKVPGITSGTGSMQSAFKAQVTKMGNGQTQNLTSTTLQNGVTSGVVGGSLQQISKELGNAAGGNQAAQAIDDRMGKCLPANPHC